MDYGDLDERMPETLAADPWERELRHLLDRMDERVGTVIVEGPRDQDGLRAAGVTAPIRACGNCEGLMSFVETIEGSPIAILTDFDDHGRHLNGRFRDLLPDHRVEPRWRRDLGLLLTQRGRYDIESLNNVFGD